MKVRFWGVRGSVASPGPETLVYGGNTSCVEVETAGRRFVFDAGTGLRRLGNSLLGGGDVELTVILSHLHWDHIQGLPFFAPLYRRGTRLELVSGQHSHHTLDILRRQMSAPTFPVDLQDLPAELSVLTLRDLQTVDLHGARLTTCRANHPDQVYAYRLEAEGVSVVYATDTEHYSCVDPRLRLLAEGADLLIYDAQYLPEEYAGLYGPGRVGWGHSTYEAATCLAQTAGVRELVLFHHDPARTDAQVDRLVGLARALFPNTRAAREGDCVEVGQGAFQDAA